MLRSIRSMSGRRVTLLLQFRYVRRAIKCNFVVEQRRTWADSAAYRTLLRYLEDFS